MKKWLVILVVLVVVIFAAALVYIFNEDEVESDKGRGVYYHEQGFVLGSCLEWDEFDNGDSGAGTVYTEYYHKEDGLIGKCWSYHGPGSSGGAGTGCDTDELLGDAIEESALGGKRFPKYDCDIYEE
ncbi:hypothetical protein HN935_02450 [archaeon]|jgi:hypothetical protein|nr:hypothetical protein [archaeon]